MHRLFMAIGATAGFLAVGFGAFAAHSLKQSLEPALLISFQTAARYQMYHALALVVISLLVERAPLNLWLKLCGWLFVVGILLFCGSLYFIALTKNSMLGIITPIGGLFLLAGWASMFVASLKTINHQ